MKWIIIVVLLTFLGCKNDTKETDIVESNQVQEIPKDEATEYSNIVLEVYDYDGLEPLLNKIDDKIHVVNFWATWCAPCVKELPYFEEVNKRYKDRNVEVLLVSLDFPKNYDSKLKPFMEEQELKSQIVALNDTDQNRWIPAINEDWSGAIPATIIYKGSKRQFYEKSFTKEELEKEISEFLK